MEHQQRWSKVKGSLYKLVTFHKYREVISFTRPYTGTKCLGYDRVCTTNTNSTVDSDSDLTVGRDNPSVEISIALQAKVHFFFTELDHIMVSVTKQGVLRE